MFLEQPQPLLHAGGMSTRRSRQLSDILPQFTNMHNKNSISELETRSGGSVRIQHFVPPPPPEEGKSRFPKLEECAHFHYEHVELSPLQLQLYDDDDLKTASLSSSINEGSTTGDMTASISETKWWMVKVTSGGQCWLLRRSYENFRMLDYQLHRCIYDRKFSALPELPNPVPESDKEDAEMYVKRLLSRYLERLSLIAGSLINCGPVLSWMELDNRGRRLLVTEGDNCPINTPAVAAAYSVVKYTAVAADEISFDIGDMISVIDMPPPEESVWWRGKREFNVGFFPADCVVVITDRVPRNLQLRQALTIPPYGEPSKPVLKKHGKLIAFFRAFILSRPSRRRLKQTGILKERVFGCDLGEHLLNTDHDIPMVLKCCSEFIEAHGIVDGIYRLSGVTSNIQKLRHTFDEDRIPDLYKDDSIVQDIHSVASLLKMYFRELPNPLCTYQLYHSFVSAVQQPDLETKLQHMRETVEKLPPPHRRTLDYLIGHLSRVAAHGSKTGMTARNVAIVWAPNLLRCKELEFGGVAALQGVGVQAVVTEFLVLYYSDIFEKKNIRASTAGGYEHCRPKSLVVSSTPTKLLSLEEAQSRALLSGTTNSEQDYIEVGGGPSCLPVKYHTVIDLPGRSRRRKRSSSSSGGTSSKRSPLGWRSLFTRSSNKGESQRKSSMPDCNAFGQMKAKSEDRQLTKDHLVISLRPVKSAESLTPSNSNPGSSRNSACLDTLPGHSRSVSHDSYFDQITSPHKEKKKEEGIEEGDEKSSLKEEDRGLSMSLDLSELQVNFELEESEMRLFSDEDASLMCIISPIGTLEKNVTKKEISLPKLQLPREEDNKDEAPSPSKRRSCLEERLSDNCDLRYIDSASPDQFLVEAEVYHRLNSSNSSMGCSTPSQTTHTPMTDDSCDNLPKYTLLTSDTPRNRFSYHGDTTNTYDNLNVVSAPNDRHSYQDAAHRESMSDCMNSSLSNADQSSIRTADSNKSLLSMSIRSVQYENLTNSESQMSLTSSASTMTQENRREANVYENFRSSPLLESHHVYDEVARSVPDPGTELHSDSSSNTSGGFKYQTLTSSAEMLDNAYDEVAPENLPYANVSDPLSTSTLDQHIYEPINNYLHTSCSPPAAHISHMQASDTPSRIINNVNEAAFHETAASLGEQESHTQCEATTKEKRIPSNINTQFDSTSSGVKVDGPSSHDECLSPTRLLVLSLDENRRKFESEIGRDLMREQKMRQELGANYSTTGNSFQSKSVSEITNQFEWKKSNKERNLPPCVRARTNRSKQNANLLTTSLDSSTFPSDGDEGSSDNLQRVITSPDLKEGEENNNHLEEADRRQRIERYKEERRRVLRNNWKGDPLKSDDDKRDEEMISRLKQKVKLNVTTQPQSTTPTPFEDALKSPTKTTVSILYTPTVSNTFIKDVSPTKTKFDQDTSGCRALSNKENVKVSPLRKVSKNEFTSSISKEKSNTRPPVCEKPLLMRELNKCPISKSMTTTSVEKTTKSQQSFVARRVNQLSTTPVATPTPSSNASSKEQIVPSPTKQLVKCSSFTDPNQAKITYDRQRVQSQTTTPQPICIRDMKALFENKTVK